MFANRYLRLLIGMFLCGAAALSLYSMLLPFVFATLDITDTFWARLILSDYAAHAVLLWAVAGGWLSRAGGLVRGGVLLALIGVGTGFWAALQFQGLSLMSITTVCFCGGFYGMIAGLLVGRLLDVPRNEPAGR